MSPPPPPLSADDIAFLARFYRGPTLPLADPFVMKDIRIITISPRQNGKPCPVAIIRILARALALHHLSKTDGSTGSAFGTLKVLKFDMWEHGDGLEALMRALCVPDPLSICVNLHITCWHDPTRTKPTTDDLFKSSKRFKFWYLRSLTEELKRAEAIITPGCIATLPEFNITIVEARYQVVGTLLGSNEREVVQWVVSAVVGAHKSIVEEAWHMCMLGIPDRTKLLNEAVE